MPGDGLRVVVVDDHELFRGGLVQLLQERGIKVLGEAGLAAEGIRQASELHPDVVLMDLNMPGMSGIEATQRLSAMAPLARVLVLTSWLINAT
jgi:two-component system, NarL family, nitrate/nitrite response regulator NarL